MFRLAVVSLLFVLATGWAVCAPPADLVLGYLGPDAAVIQAVGKRVSGQWRPPEGSGAIAEGTWRAFTLFGEGSALLAGPSAVDSGSIVCPLMKAGGPESLVVLGGHPRQPRHGRRITPDFVVGQVTALLSDHGVKTPRPRVTQCVEIDLLGDGDPEYLVCASSRDEMRYLGAKRKPTDYSLAALVWITPRGPRRAAVPTIEALALETVQAPEAPSRDYHFVGAADLDGSGAMDFTLASLETEGTAVTLCGFDGRAVLRRVTVRWKS